MFSGLGPDRRVARIRASSRSTRPVSRSRKLKRPSSPRSGQQAAQRLLVIARPPRPATTVEMRGRLGQGQPQVGGHDAAGSRGERPLQHDQVPWRGERLADGVHGERPERGDAEHADPHAVGAQLVDHVLDGAEHRAERDDDDVRVLGRYGRTRPPESRPNRPNSAAIAAVADDAERLLHAFVGQVADLGERLGADHGADRDRLAPGRAPGAARTAAGTRPPGRVRDVRPARWRG